jgi:AraC-like DNA-binding protein
VHFAREFKRLTGFAPHQYVLGRRVERARALLARGERSITEVALTVGFSSQSHLTTAFRRVYGTTPAAYRNQRKFVEPPRSAAISSDRAGVLCDHFLKDRLPSSWHRTGRTASAWA